MKLERMLKIELKEAEAQLRLFEASVREVLSKLDHGGEEGEERGGAVRTDLVKNLNVWVKSHLETRRNLSKREEELAVSRKGICFKSLVSLSINFNICISLFIHLFIYLFINLLND